MSILQQLSETKLTQEEIAEILDLCEHSLKVYKQNLKELQNVIDVAKGAEEDPNVQAVIKVTLQKDDSYESVEKTLEELIEYKEEVLRETSAAMNLMESAVNKLKLLSQIFE